MSNLRINKQFTRAEFKRGLVGNYYVPKSEKIEGTVFGEFNEGQIGETSIITNINLQFTAKDAATAEAVNKHLEDLMTDALKLERTR